MPTIVGGLRQRLVFDSLKLEIERALTELGWFVPPAALTYPVNFITEPVDDRTEVPLNTLVLVAEDKFRDPLELGSSYSEHRRTYYLDLYAENQSIGEHLIFDLEAILEGQMSSIGRSDPIFSVYDYTQATPPEISVAEIEDVIIDRGRLFSYPWQKFWYSAQFVVVDSYGNEDD